MEFLLLSRRRSSTQNVPSGEERGETDVFRRLGVSVINHIWGDLWVLQGSGNFIVLFLRSVISLKLPTCAVVFS